MFEQLKRRTLELLAEKAANYPFDEYPDNEEEKEDGKNAENEEEEYDRVEGIAMFGADNGQLMNALGQICDKEMEKIINGEEYDDGFNLEELLGNDHWDERLKQLQKCTRKLKELGKNREKCEQNLRELSDKYNSVADKTSSLHDACERMMSEQTQLAAANERISANLHYYQQYDWLLKKLATPKLSLTGVLFTQILSTIHECISYLHAHPEQREAADYLQKYEQCLSRSLTAIKAGVLSDLEACRQDVLYRQSRSQANHGDNRAGGMLSYVDNDDTFALIYGVFGVKANAIRNAFQQAHQFFADYPEYQTVVSECEHEYFVIRDQLLRPIVNTTIQVLCQRHQNSSCTLTRDSCTFLLRLCDDEFRLYRQFFVLSGTADGGTRTSMTPSTPSIFSFWSPLSAQQSNQFDTFIEGLCRILYDTLRPLIIHNPHLETLAQLCTLLKIQNLKPSFSLFLVEMIDERCGLIPMAPMSSSASINVESQFDQTMPQQQQMGNPRAGFAHVINELVTDIVERIVYRTTLFAQSDILDYNPAAGDLVYPERLLMMRQINEGAGVGKGSNHSQIESSQPAVEDGEEGAESIGPLPQTQRRGTTTTKLIKTATTVNSTSPIDQHCLWYPTVKRTVMCLSKLYRCLDITVFMNVSRELLDACCQSLEHAVERIRTLQIDPAHTTIHGCPNRLLDAELFIVKHLLILREQTSPYRQHQKHTNQQRPPPFTRSNSVLSSGSGGGGTGTGMNTPMPIAVIEPQIHPQLDYQLDLGKYTHSMFQLLNAENRARWFEFGSNNALLSLLLLTPVHVSELQTDTRRIIEQHLKRWCHSMIMHICSLLLGPLVNFQDDLDKFQAEQEQRVRDHQQAPLDVTTSDRFSPRALHDRAAHAFKQLKLNWPQVRAAFSLYIGVHETEEILLQPIRRAVNNAFTALSAFAERHYEEEQRQVISAPGPEQIWLILNTPQQEA